MKRLFVLLLIVIASSCARDFSTPRYHARVQTGTVWKRKKLPIWKTGSFNNSLIKKEARRDMMRPKTFSLDPW